MAFNIQITHTRTSMSAEARAYFTHLPLNRLPANAESACLTWHSYVRLDQHGLPPTTGRIYRNWIRIYLTFMRGLSEKVKLKAQTKTKTNTKTVQMRSQKAKGAWGGSKICRAGKKNEESQSTAASQLWVDVMKENLCKLCHVFGLHNFLIFHSSACTHTHAHRQRACDKYRWQQRGNTYTHTPIQPYTHLQALKCRRRVVM